MTPYTSKYTFLYFNAQLYFYVLDSLAEEGLYFIVSLKDFVVAKPRNDDDHIAWLLEHERYKVFEIFHYFILIFYENFANVFALVSKNVLLISVISIHH